MKRLNGRQIAALVVVACLGVAVWWFLASFELKMEKQKSPVSQQARADRFLALARVFEAKGYELTRITWTEDWMDSSLELLVIDQEVLAEELDYAGSEELEEWLQAGGRMVVFITEVDDLDEATADFIRRAGIEVTAEPDSGDEPASTDSPPGRFTQGTRYLSIAWDYGVLLQASGEVAPLSQGEAGGKLRWLQMPTGKGWIAITGQGSFWENANLGKLDHAALIGQLFSPEQPIQNIVLVKTYQDEPPPPWPASWLALIAPVIALGVVMVWNLAPRLGPAQHLVMQERRSMGERFSADGRFLWHRAPPGTIESRIRFSFRQHIARKSGGGDHSKMASWLESQTGIPQAAWLDTLDDAQPKTANAEAFRQLMNLTETTRRRL